MSDSVYRYPYRRPPQALRWIPDLVAVPVTVTPDTASLTLTTFAPAIIIPADFPFTDTLDDFNRANGSLGANWGGKLFNSDGALAIDTNLVKGVNAGSNNNQGWNTQVAPDCEVYVEIVSSADTNRVLVALRWSALDTDTPDGYAARALGGATNNVLVFRFDNGAATTIATISQVVDDGDWLGLRMAGDVLGVFYKDISVSSNWIQIGEVEDTTHSAAGHLGLLLEGDTGRADNFSGGTIGAVTVTPASVSLTLSTFAPQLQVTLTPASTSLTLTTFAPSVIIIVTVPAASLSLTTFAPTVTATAHVTVTPVTASLALTTFAVQLREVVTPANQSLTLTMFTAKLVQAVTPASASLSLTAFAPTVTTNTILTPASVALTLTANAPQLREATTPSAASLSLATFAPTVTTTAHVTVTPTTATLTLTGFPPQLREQVTPSATTLTLTTFAPELRLAVTPATATLSLSTSAPVLVLDVQPVSAMLVLTVFAPIVEISGDITLTPAQANLTLTTFAPTVTAGVIITPRRRTFMVGFARRTFIVQRPKRIYLAPESDREEVLV